MINLRSGIKTQQDQDISLYLNDTCITESDRKEFIQNAKYEEKFAQQPSGLSMLEDVTSKSNFIKTFEQVFPELDIASGASVLEMGACHAWASTLVKLKHPDCYVVASDLVSEMVKHSHNWEQFLGAQLDEKWAFNCRDIPFEDEQFDRIFTFASFHHFGDCGNFQPALTEMTRILKKGGKIVLLYEPACPRFLYPLALKWVNSKRDGLGEEVDEDVLVPSELEKVVAALGCTLKTNLFPFPRYRDGFLTGNYYYLLSKFPPLQNLALTTANFIIEK